MVDVAQALGERHGCVHRHFPTRAALRDAVTARGLADVMAPLTAIVESDGPAPERLRARLVGLNTLKDDSAVPQPRTRRGVVGPGPRRRVRRAVWSPILGGLAPRA